MAKWAFCLKNSRLECVCVSVCIWCVNKTNLRPMLLIRTQETGITQNCPWFILSTKNKQESFTCSEKDRWISTVTELIPKVWLQDEGSCKTDPQIYGCLSPLWLTTAAACLHLAAGGSPIHIIFSIWSLTESLSFGSIGLCEIRDSMVRRTRPLTGLRGEERPPNTTRSPPGKEVTVWYSLTSAGEQMISHTLSHDKKQLAIRGFSPSSPDVSTLTELQPLQPFRRSLGAALLPTLLEPPVRRTCLGLSRQVAIPSPSTLSGMGWTLRTGRLREDGTMHGTADSGANKQISSTQSRTTAKHVLFYS